MIATYNHCSCQTRKVLVLNNQIASPRPCSLQLTISSLQLTTSRPQLTTSSLHLILLASSTITCEQFHIFMDSKSSMKFICYIHVKSFLTTTQITHQICSFIFFPPNSTVLILKSIPDIQQHSGLSASHSKQLQCNETSFSSMSYNFAVTRARPIPCWYPIPNT